MPELRKDPIVGRWVIIATERAMRPNDFKGDAQAAAFPDIVEQFGLGQGAQQGKQGGQAVQQAHRELPRFVMVFSADAGAARCSDSE